jgi:hypothetical protein
MTYYQISFTRRKTKAKKSTKKGKRKNKYLVCGQYTNACKLGANLKGQKAIKFHHNNFKFS